jgi:hypothetical protein
MTTRTSTRLGVVAVSLVLATLGPLVVSAQPRIVVTVQELIQRDHRLEVAAGTEVAWNDPHFERVWFPARAGQPRVERTTQGFRAVFAKAGTYRGAFTIAGGHRSEDVYPLIVTVTER